MITSVLGLFLTVPWVGLQCVIATYPSHTHLLFLFGVSALWQTVFNNVYIGKWSETTHRSSSMILLHCYKIMLICICYGIIKDCVCWSKGITVL